MKSNINVLRREEQIKNLLAQIITYDLNNANIIEPTVVDCKLSNDLSHVKVYLTFAQNSTKGLEAINNAKGYIRKQVARNLDWRKVPELNFELDEVSKEALRIDKILHNIKENN
ncbi:30S ribosome-binding factor RbfA [Mycoplasmopsis columbinasalis]|uniref:Ribosome-binding factor A n=1 Tax=Mycoplasmopsis columbinasalis TaxID=114880 RepID=A0A449BAB5_9BACT|nr:30S ribosome-binding factor RbfA [Mycoplasmopsis columbinasalis]VEU78143.1 Ribosome-binding factor A [Mycoplasmopsis columbinasalis]